MKVRPPAIEADHPEYRVQCEEAVDLALREVVDVAIAAGWNRMSYSRHWPM